MKVVEVIEKVSMQTNIIRNFRRYRHANRTEYPW